MKHPDITESHLINFLVFCSPEESIRRRSTQINEHDEALLYLYVTYIKAEYKKYLWFWLPCLPYFLPLPFQNSVFSLLYFAMYFMELFFKDYF
jgi:hypothetical protein